MSSVYLAIVLFHFLMPMKRVFLFMSTLVLCVGSIALAEAPNGFGDDSQVVELHVQGTDQLQLDSGGDGKFLDIVSGAVNWVLGVLALIALIVVIIGGLLMVTAAGNADQYNRGRKFLKGAIVGIILIGVAWFIASMLFWLISTFASSAEGAPTPNSNT